MIILVLILSFFIRLINLNQSLWLDESIEVLAVKSNSYINLITKYSLGDFHPPLYHLILKFWTDVFGYSEISVRLPSVIFGAGIVFFVYLIARHFWNKHVAILAAVFMALSPLAIYYSQEARMYSLAAFAVTAAFYFFLRKKWWLYIFFFTIALYCDYLPFLMFPVFLLLSENKKRYLMQSLIFVIFFLPWLPFFFPQFHIGTTVAKNVPGWHEVVGQFSLKSIPLTLVKFIIGRITINNKFLYTVVMGSVSATYTLCIIKAKSKSITLWLLVPIVLGFFLSTIVPVYSYFRFLFVLPAFVLLLSKGSEKSLLLKGLIIFVSLASIAVFNLTPDFQRENWRSATNYLASDPGLVVMPNLAQSAPLDYYSNKLNIVDAEKLPTILSGQNINELNTVYLLRYVQEIFDPKDQERKQIESQGFIKTEEKSFTGGLLIWKYQK